jgi:ATP-dependent exoDNAse (exonuclease V) beta subunit
MSVLEPDSYLRLPSVTVLKASAGSGKTRTLTERYVQFLLSPLVPKNSLGNILAITFSNNASREMKESILVWLKSLSLRNPGRLAEVAEITTGGEAEIVRKSAEAIEGVLGRFSDFQVRTIDSFMATIFRASAIELGIPPDFRIELDCTPAVEYAFDLFLRDARPGSTAAAVLDSTVAAIATQKGEAGGFLWEPASALRSQLMEIEKRVGLLEADPCVEETEPDARRLKSRIRDSMEEVHRLVQASGLEEDARSRFRSALDSARAGMFADISTRSLATGPAKKPASNQPSQLVAWERISAVWEEIRMLAGEYAAFMARSYYAPYLRLHAELSATLERVKKARGIAFISDVNRKLLSCLSEDMVPEVYFRIGERVFHYLIDEFQDTSPMQWKNLLPLIENSLAQGGSLFVVGDTKQAIYGFRHADYRIMRSVENENPFPSAQQHTTLSLHVNFRSRPAVIHASERVFLENAALLPEYKEAAHQSGLDEWRQTPQDSSAQGHVSVEVLDRNDDDPPERARLHEVIDDLRQRGYRWGDIAVLASRNDQVIKVTSWLNEKGIPFISYSSLDVRRRKTAGEILALLSFLDSPKDDLSFVTFILGDLFAAVLSDGDGSLQAAQLHRFLVESRNRRPLYKAFQGEFPETWERFFAGLFRSTGYLPLYDLASEIYAVFRVFERKLDEEATFAKFLETIKDFEGQGSNSLRDFLRFASSSVAGPDAEGAWDIDVPDGADSVRAMTIHKAKGLGFPVVIALLYGERSHGFSYTVTRDRDGQIRLVKLTRRLSQGDRALSALYDRELLQDKVSRLNGLYVALTRAKEEMYVIGVRRERDSFPFDLLPGSGFTEGAVEQAPSAGLLTLTPALLSHMARPVPPSVSAKRLSTDESQRGELAHAALSQIMYVSADIEADIHTALERSARVLRVDNTGADIAASAVALINSPPLAELFRPLPGRSVFTEWEVCNGEGRLFRMDRVVLDKERVTVVDWKTGAEEAQADGNEEQIRNYARILQHVYPGREIRAFLAYLDKKETRFIQ